jgi:AraC-like DNA-binding protein
MIRDMSAPFPGPHLPEAAESGTIVSRARTHLATLRGIPEVLEQLGVPCEPILNVANLTRGDFDDPERSAPFDEMDRLIGVCVRRTGCAHFGLLLSQYVNLQSFGLPGRLALHAPSVGVALQELAAHFVLQESGGVPSVAIHDGAATFAYGIHALGIRNADQIYDLSVGAMLNIMRQLCGESWQPDFVMLPRKRPGNLRPYREILRVPIRFDAPQAAVVFRESHLLQPIAGADPFLHALIESHARAALARQGSPLQAHVRRAIRLLLAAGNCSRVEVARQLDMHERTLGRRLQASGMTFQALLDETRAEMARQLLQDTRSSIARIAHALGYQDPTIFTRAFRRWTGATPRAFRASLPTTS